MADMKKVLASAAGATVAAGAALAVTRRIRKGGRPHGPTETVYHLAPTEEGWSIRAEDADQAIAILPTKKDGVTRARDLARNQAPARLVIHRTDGTIQQQHSYTVPA